MSLTWKSCYVTLAVSSVIPQGIAGLTLRGYRVTDTKKQQVYQLGTKMSFRTGSLDHDVIVFCPVTGIIGKLEMPWLPVNLSYDHPLAKATNVLLLLRKYFQRRQVSTDVREYIVTPEMLSRMFLEIDRQVLAGCVLSLLRDKHLLRTEAETTAAEQNLVLQNAGSDILCKLLSAILQHWENPQVWKRMPGLNVEFSLFATQSGAIAQTLQSYTRLLRNALNPEELTREEASKIFAAQKRSSIYAGRRVRIYSASAVQHRQIRDNKPEANRLLEQLKPQLSIVLRTRLAKAIKDMLLLPLGYKVKIANELALAKLSENNNPVRTQLINILRSSDTGRILDELGTLSMEVSPRPIKSIADIVAHRQALKEDKQDVAEDASEAGADTPSEEREEFGFDDAEGEEIPDEQE